MYTVLEDHCSTGYCSRGYCDAAVALVAAAPVAAPPVADASVDHAPLAAAPVAAAPEVATHPQEELLCYLTEERSLPMTKHHSVNPVPLPSQHQGPRV